MVRTTSHDVQQESRQRDAEHDEVVARAPALGVELHQQELLAVVEARAGDELDLLADE